MRKIKMWNRIALAKYVWKITIKQDNLWVKCMHEVYIKDAEWWDYEPPLDRYWYWKQICKIKNRLKVIYSK